MLELLVVVTIAVMAILFFGSRYKAKGIRKGKNSPRRHR
jgi:hypothetical protein